MTPSDIALLATYYFVLCVLTIFAVHRFHLVMLRRRVVEQNVFDVPAPSAWPKVTIQLPLYNEPNVAARLIEAALKIDYPGELDIQVIDDSTDETSAIVAAAAAPFRESGTRVSHVRRAQRSGYKAGALAEAMLQSDAELFAIFDADFIPTPDFLLRTVPHFADERVGMVQARWAHLNRNDSTLTRIQAIYLDGHFAVESAARCLSGRFFNFNGTAGVWRRKAIDDAGGWSAATLTEDLDLSYRAQLAGWKFVFLPNVEVPAELPSTLAGFHGQQHRWAKGSIQTARRVLPSILRADLPWRTRLEAIFHLTNNTAYLLTLILSVLLVPALVVRNRLGLTWTLGIDAPLFFASSSSLWLFYREGERRVGATPPRLRDMMRVVPFGIGMSVVNALAVLEGLVQRGGHFNRTPKSGGTSKLPDVEKPPRVPLPEIILAIFLAFAAVMFLRLGYYVALPFVVLFLSGYAHVSILGVRDRIEYGRTSSARLRIQQTTIVGCG